MGFYQSKLKSYSKFVKFDEKTMAEMQRKIIEAKEKYLTEMKEDLRLTRRFHLEETNGYDETTIALAEQEIAFLKTLNVVDFYNHMINVENYNLTQILNESAEKVNNYFQAMERYNKNANSKNKIVAGISNRKAEKNYKLSYDENLTVSFTAESMAEWKGLIPDDQVVYIMGRQEVEGISNFDKNGFDYYKNNIYKLNHIKDSQNQENQVEKQ